MPDPPLSVPPCLKIPNPRKQSTKNLEHFGEISEPYSEQIRVNDSKNSGTFRSALSGPTRDTPPYRAIPFRDSIAEGGISRFCFFHRVSRKYCRDTPFVGGVSHLHFACSPRGKCSEKGEGVSHPIGHVETPNPIARNRGVSLR